jgi:2-(3-amino-3-carboxypropyl)histidine synthase
MSEFSKCDKDISQVCCSSHQDEPVRNSSKQQQICNTNDSNIEQKPLALVKKKVVVSKSIKKNQIPDDIINNEALNLAIKNLPINYNFEIHKTIWRIRTEGSKLVALQFPEGLLLYACIITDILIKFAKVEVLVLGDVTYGACCIDDYTAQKLGASLLVHYGHSCLVPINVTRIKVMYVFVEIHFDFSHLINCVIENFDKETKLALMGTIQFTTAIHSARVELAKSYPNIFIPQSKPLSGGNKACYMYLCIYRSLINHIYIHISFLMN